MLWVVFGDAEHADGCSFCFCGLPPAEGGRRVWVIEEAPLGAGAATLLRRGVDVGIVV